MSSDLPLAPGDKFVLGRSQSKAMAACPASLVRCKRQILARWRAQRQLRSAPAPAETQAARSPGHTSSSMDEILATTHKHTPPDACN